MEQPFQYNRLPKIDAWGKPKFVQDYSLFHALFTEDIPPRLFRIVENGTEVSTSTNATSHEGMLKLDSTGLTTLEVSSYRHPRYQPNRGVYYAASWILPDWQKDCTFEFGLFNTGTSGLFFRVRAGRIYAVRLSLGVESIEEIMLPKGATLAYGCLYDIQAQWRGIGSILFMVTHSLGTTVHTMNLLGKLSALSVSNPALKIAQRVIPNTEDGIMYCGCIDYSSEGGINERLQYASSHVLDLNVNNGDGVLAVRLPQTINGNPNTRDAQLVRVSIQADKKADYALYASRISAAVTASGWTSLGGGSFIEQADSITAVDLNLANFISVFPVAAGAILERTNPFPDKIDFYLTAGDVVFIYCTSGTGVSTTAVMEFGEEI